MLTSRLTSKYRDVPLPSDLASIHDVPPDFVVSYKSDGSPCSRHGDNRWIFSAYHSSSISIRFANDGSTDALEQSNAAAAKVVVLALLYIGHHPLGAGSLQTKLCRLREILKACNSSRTPISEFGNSKICQAELRKHIRPSSLGSTPLLMHELALLSEEIGFTLCPPALIPSFYPAGYSANQTLYIPNRIHSYVLNQCDAIVSLATTHIDLLKNSIRSQLYEAFNLAPPLGSQLATEDPSILPARLVGIFDSVYGTLDHRYPFLTYITAIRDAGMILLCAHSGMRISEARTLKRGCLRQHQDPAIGPANLIVGVPAKIHPMTESTWICSDLAAKAIHVLEAISAVHHEMRHTRLVSGSFSNWLFTSILGWKKKQHSIDPPRVSMIERMDYPWLFDPEALKVTADDLRVSELINGNSGGRVVLGEPWPFAFHQLRRTLVVNSVRSGTVALGSIQLQLKHLHLGMTEYYVRGYHSLSLNESMRIELAEELANEAARVANGLADSKHFSPHGSAHKSRLLELISTSDLKGLAKLASQGTLSVRPTLLGVCLKKGDCAHGGYDTLSHCVTCPEALLDKGHVVRAEMLIAHSEPLLEALRPSGDSPRMRALEGQVGALREFVIRVRSNE